MGGLMQLVAYGHLLDYEHEQKEKKFIASLTPIQRKLYLKKREEEKLRIKLENEKYYEEKRKKEEIERKKRKERMKKYYKNIIIGIGYSEKEYGVSDICWCNKCKSNEYVKNTWVYCFKNNGSKYSPIFDFAIMLRRLNFMKDLEDKWDDDLTEAYNSEERYDNVMYITEDRNGDSPYVPKLYIEEYYDHDGYGDILYHGYDKIGSYNVADLFRIRRVLKNYIRRRRAGKKIVAWAREIGENPRSANPFIMRALIKGIEKELEEIE